MLKFFIDVFCKDTVIGLCKFEDVRVNKLYKNKYSPLFKKREEHFKKVKFAY